jgi:membrane protease YdiL (CAAX protease family)
MDALDPTDSAYRPPGNLPPTHTLPPPSPPGAPPPDPSGLTASKGLIGLVVALVGGLGMVLLVMVGFAAFGANDLDHNHAFEFAAAFASDFALVAAAYWLTSETGGSVPFKLGFRRFKPSALGWAALAFGVYLALATIYTVLFNPPKDDLPDQLGADESTLLAIVTGVFVIGVAPLVEETFFRGFLFQALRSSWGVWIAVPASAVIFSAIHLEPDKFVQLAILGMALAFVFHKTRSLWPCIILHALNNTLAFIALVVDKS